MSNIAHGAADAVVSRLPSPKIWADCPVMQIMADPAKGFYLWDDFKNSVVLPAMANTDRLIIAGDINWDAIVESDDIADLAIQSDDDGWLMMDSDGQDDDMYAITAGKSEIGNIRLPKKGERKRFWFEVRFKVNTITNTDLSFFLGFMQPGVMADGVPLGGAPTAPASYDYLGFFVAEADGSDLTIIYEEPGSGSPVSDTGEITLVADKFVRVGFRLDVSTDKLHVYKDGVDQGADAEIDISSVNFPSNTNVNIMIVLTSGAQGGDGDNLKIDWVRFAQEY